MSLAELHALFVHFAPFVEMWKEVRIGSLELDFGPEMEQYDMHILKAHVLRIVHAIR